MSTLAFLVNEEAEYIEAQLTKERRYAWGLGVGTIIMAISVLIFCEWVLKKATHIIALSTFLSEAASLCLYFVAPVWFMLWREKGKRAFNYALGIYALALVVMGLTDYLTKGGLQEELHLSERAGDIRLLWGFLMLLPWVPLLLLARRYPSSARRIGLSFSNLGENLGVGVLAGAAMGLHLLTVVGLIKVELVRNPWPYMTWLLFYELGIQSLSEELFFRGFVFNYLYNYEKWGIWRAAFVAGVANVVIYMTKYLWVKLTIIMIGAWFYILTMAVVNALLYRWKNNIFVCCISNAIFSLFSSLVIT